MSPKHLNTIAWLRAAARNLGRFLLGVALLPVALLLLAMVIICAAGHYLATIKRKRQNIGEILTGNGVFSILISLGVDHLGNIIGGQFFNWLLLKGDTPFPFGKAGESLSEIVGWNYSIGNLNEWGLNLRHDLNTIEKNHCEIAVDKAVANAKYIVQKNEDINNRIETLKRTKAVLANYN